MKKMMLIMLACTTATTVSYSGDRLEMLNETYSGLKDKGPNAKKLFDESVKIASEDYQAAASRTQSLLEAVENEWVVFKKSEDDKKTLRGVLEESPELSATLKTSFDTVSEFEQIRASLILKLQTLEFKSLSANFLDMRNFLEKKVRDYIFKAEMIKDFYLNSANTRWNGPGEKKQEKDPFEKVKFYKNLLDSIDENPKIKIQHAFVDSSIKINSGSIFHSPYMFAMRKSEKIEYGKIILDGLRQKNPDDKFLNTQYATLAEKLDDLATSKVKERFGDFAHGPQTFNAAEFLRELIPEALDFISAEKYEKVIKPTVEDFKPFLQEHLTKWKERAAKQKASAEK